MSHPATESGETIAALDLGSNSFHLIVARLHGGEVRVVDRLREMVRLGGGLDAERRIVPEVKRRALECLGRFGERLSGLPAERVRAVGTNTLRSVRDSGPLVEEMEQALGHSISIISGVEEARLIYLGVAHSLASDGRRRLVMDIGGGSTELIVGQGFETYYMESLYMGCVSMTRSRFADGKITRKAVRRALLDVRMELEPVTARFRRLGWDRPIGASGTIRAVERVVCAAGWSREGITLASLRRLKERLLELGRSDRLDRLAGLGGERAPVFAGGVMVLLGWAAEICEIGLSIAHSQYHKHGAYIAEHSDLAGFSRQEQKLLATLIRAHRRKFPVAVFRELPKRQRRSMVRLAVLLRLAVLFHRSRSGAAAPPVGLEAGKDSLRLYFPTGWLERHPLVSSDLEQEAAYLAAAGFRLLFR